MIRLISIRLSADTPFRYGKKVSLSRHIKSKNFGHEVLLFGTPRKLRSEAAAVIHGQGEKQRGRAFWEILTKRVNESVHLLSGSDISMILTAYEQGEAAPEMTSSICHFVGEEIANGRTEKYTNIEDLTTVLRLLNFSGVRLDSNESLYESAVAAVARLSWQISTAEQVKEVVEQLGRLKGNTSTEAEDVLAKRLLRKLGSSEEQSFSALVRACST